MSDQPSFNHSPVPVMESPVLEQYLAEEFRRLEQFSIDVTRNSAFLKEVSFLRGWL